MNTRSRKGQQQNRTRGGRERCENAEEERKETQAGADDQRREGKPEKQGQEEIKERESEKGKPEGERLRD